MAIQNFVIPSMKIHVFNHNYLHKIVANLVMQLHVDANEYALMLTKWGEVFVTQITKIRGFTLNNNNNSNNNNKWCYH